MSVQTTPTRKNVTRPIWAVRFARDGKNFVTWREGESQLAANAAVAALPGVTVL